MKLGIALLSPGTWERFSAYFESRGESLPPLYARQAYAPPAEPHWPIPRNRTVNTGERGPRALARDEDYRAFRIAHDEMTGKRK